MAVNSALILCPSAQRDRETLASILPYLDGSSAIKIDESQYNFDQKLYLTTSGDRG
jgi:hypothetical protein